MGGLDLYQVKSQIVLPTLEAIGLYSPSAVNLLTGTALAESGLIYLHQLNGGPALGLWQMEPATYNDCWSNFLSFDTQIALRTQIESLMSSRAVSFRPLIVVDAPSCPARQEVITNLAYACAMARVKYFRAPQDLPPADDARALSEYHKDIYNTSLGAADFTRNIPLFQAAISA